MRWTPPSQIEEYRVLGPLGRGATGSVYLARDLLLDREVAIKFVDVEGDRAWQHQLILEARAIAKLQHRNVVAAYRVGQLLGRTYLVTELVRGQALDQLPRPLPWRRVLELAIGLARGLGAAHRHGILHRDIKPANAMLSEDGEVKLLDFGLATEMDSKSASLPAATLPRRDFRNSADTTETISWSEAGRSNANTATAGGRDTEEPVGSPLYMAPELWRGERATSRSDIYSLGVILYELCSGEAPHRGVPVSELPHRVQNGSIVPLHRAVPSIGSHFALIVDRCLSLRPRMRFTSGDALLAALETCASASASPTSIIDQVERVLPLRMSRAAKRP